MIAKLNYFSKVHLYEVDSVRVSHQSNYDTFIKTKRTLTVCVCTFHISNLVLLFNFNIGKNL